jgi:hypothetical protein
LKDAIAEVQRQKTTSVKSKSLETLLTTEVTDQLNSLLKKSQVSVVNEWHLKSGKEEKRGAIDITFYDKADFDEKDEKRSDEKMKCY